MDQPKHLFIVNPATGRGISDYFIQHIDHLFETLATRYPSIRWEIVRTRYPGEATEIARDFAQKAPHRIYAVGGDGTLNEVLNGMAGTDSSLACIPGGSGNDFIKSLTGSMAKEDLLRRTILGEERRIDIGRAGEHYFINIASVGFDAKVNYATDLYKGKPYVTTHMAYLLGIASNLKNLSPLHVTVECEGRPREEDLFMMAICNGHTYGGGYRIAPHAQLDDGLFDVITVRNMTLPKLLNYVPKLRRGTHIYEKEVQSAKERVVRIQGETPFLINLDGESIFSDDITFTLIPRALKMVFPRPLAKDKP
ncbi:Transcription regulator [Clostridiaceae bacterium JG1575]|nr:Transcription regulator [Clostridiaceae bacterium JG1575]